MRKTYSYSAAALLLIGMSFLCGCPPVDQRPTIVGSQAPAFTVSVREAAQRLGLTVTRAEYPYVEMSGNGNRVLLFLYDGGKVYVNGKAIGPVGTVQMVSGTYYVPERLLATLRPALTGPAIAPTPQITRPTLPLPTRGGTVVIDPGHGAHDRGTKSVYNVPEKTVNLQIAHKLADILRQAGYNVIMTRDADTYPELPERAAIANRAGADLFVSIHCDWNDSSSHKGFTVYIAREASWMSKKVGRQLESTLSGAGIPSKGLRNADYKVLVQTQCPAVLVECGFMSNYEDAENLTNSWYQGKIARAIADGIMQAL